MAAKSDCRPPGWEDGRPPWNVEFHLWCDELGEQLAGLAKRAVRARGTARAHGLSVTVDAGGVPVRGETEDAPADGAVLGSALAQGGLQDSDPALWPQVVWAARATANKAAKRAAGAVVPALAQSPGGVWLVDDEGFAHDGETTTARFARGDKTNEDAVVVTVGADLVATRVVVADRLELGTRFGWLLRHAGLAMRSWQREQVRSFLADAPQFDSAGLAEAGPSAGVFAPPTASWADEGPAAADEREFFLSSVEMDFWQEAPKIESLTEALRGRNPQGENSHRGDR
ncbi:MAG: hypothetical protein ACRC20_12665 [Segniliparus sp.]|uniref:hypothetical protein n=1 Tax=Segniliparus sp. TaxID=2804064 RepID=UPI003F394BFD